MKRLLIIAFTIGLTSVSFGQTIQDKQTVIQMSIDLAELQQYYHVHEGQDRKPLIILNDGTVPTNLTLKKFGEEVQFMLKKELFFYDKQAYLDFDKFEITPTRADIEFRYDIEGLAIYLTFEKIDDVWTIQTTKLTEN